MEWARFLNVENGHTLDGKPRTRTEWAPQQGTRQEFALFLRRAFETYRTHLWDVKWNSAAMERITEARILVPASLGIPSSYWHAEHDFAAQLDNTKSHTATCAYPGRTN
jgi:hypothetical protein